MAKIDPARYVRGGRVRRIADQLMRRHRLTPNHVALLHRAGKGWKVEQLPIDRGGHLKLSGHGTIIHTHRRLPRRTTGAR